MFASKDTLLTRPSGGYSIARSVRTRSSASGYFNRTPATTTNQTTWTWSGWVKRGTLGVAQKIFAAGDLSTGNNYCSLAFTSADVLDCLNLSGGGTVNWRKTTTAVYRDPSAWYHMVFVNNSGNATAGDRFQIWINGVRVTSFSTSTDPSLSFASFVNDSTKVHDIAAFPYTTQTQFFDGYLTEINFIDGQALTPSSFGETDSITGVWKPKAYSGTYGTNGFYLNFSDNSSNTATTIGKDYSGNGNNWTPNNISVTAGTTYDSMTDVPTLTSATAANYCVLNPLDKVSSGTILDGNLATSSQTACAAGSFALTSGKWYFEGSFSSITGASSLVEVGIQSISSGQIQAYYNNGNKDADTTSSAYGATYTTSDIIGCAFDLDAKSMTFYKNGTSQGSFTYTTTDTYFPMIRARGTTTFAGTANFGQRPFTYTPPTGFVALNTYNLPAPTITNGAAYMAATTYTGTGATQAITNTVNGISFQPDLIWAKNRSSAANHNLINSVVGGSLSLQSNTTGADNSIPATSFNSNGFTLTATGAELNGSGSTYVGWQWKASGSTVSNTNGSITSTVSAGATQGFSVVTWTGTGTVGTIGHGLGSAPKFIISKSRSTAGTNWNTYSPTGVTNIVYLNSAVATTSQPNVWNSTAPTSSVFTVGTDTDSNGSGRTMVAYCWSAVAGYSAFGSYTGNGSTDGPFVYLGFRPRFVMFKLSSGVNNWLIMDSSRNTYNVADLYLAPNLSDAEASYSVVDFLSNGFKIRNTSTGWNGSGSTYIYACFAENPFKNSLAR